MLKRTCRGKMNSLLEKRNAKSFIAILLCDSGEGSFNQKGRGLCGGEG